VIAKGPLPLDGLGSQSWAVGQREALFSRRGVALAVAVVSLFAGGFLIAAVFFLAFTEVRMGRGAVEMVEALANAESAVQQRLATWDRQALNTLPVGRPVVGSRTGPAGSPAATSTVQRLGRQVFLITGAAAGQSGGAYHRVGLLVSLVPPELPHTPPLPASEGPALPRTVLDWPTRLVPDAETCAVPNGARAERERPAGEADRPEVWNPDFSRWEAIATKPLAPGRYVNLSPSTAGNACRASDPRNWGAPLDERSPCADYLPVIYASGDLEIAGGAGQGVLLVVGNLTVRGGLSFYGVVIVGGSLRASGRGGRFLGAVWAGDVDRKSAGKVTVVRSICAQERALLAAALPVPLRERSWIGVGR
jgi:hypothetical protein